MHLGHSCMIGSAGIEVVDLARRLEALGYESLWLGEHGHLPVASRIPIDHQPGVDDPEPVAPPAPYRHMPDPIVTLTAAGTVTTSLRLGLGVLLALERSPLTAAKELATLDRLCGGRLIVGVGAGWNRLELANHTSLPWSLRYRALAEYVEVLRRLWTDEEVEHHGRFFDYDPLWSYPKPLQSPVPVLFGGVGALAIEHAAAWADGWLPADDRLGDVGAALTRFRAAVERQGRDPDTVPVTLNVRLLPDASGALPAPDLLRRYRDAGVARVVLIDVSADVMPADRRWAVLEDYASLIPELSAR